MDIHDWNQRYRSGDRGAHDAAPARLLRATVEQLKPGKALDLACGTGRNALWLAEHGWSVTAVDGAAAAIDILRRRAVERRLHLDARVADLEKGEYQIESSNWDLATVCYYLQRNLFAPLKRGVAPGGILLAIVHITGPDEEPTAHRLRPGELRRYFKGWEILHCREGLPEDPAHLRPVAEIVAKRPICP